MKEDNSIQLGDYGANSNTRTSLFYISLFKFKSFDQLNTPQTASDFGHLLSCGTIATVESVLLYGSNTWTLTRKLEQQLDGTYTRMLRKALNNVSWKQHMTKEELYKNLQNVSKKIVERRLRLAGHCLRYPEEIASHLVLWQPTIGSTSRGRKVTTFVNTLKETHIWIVYKRLKQQPWTEGRGTVSLSRFERELDHSSSSSSLLLTAEFGIFASYTLLPRST